MPEINNDALTVHPFHSHSLISGAWRLYFKKEIPTCCVLHHLHIDFSKFFLSKNRAICLTYYSQIIIRNAIKCRRLWPLRTEAHPLGLRYDGAFYPLLCNRVPVRDGGGATEKISSSRIKGVQSM